MIENKKNKGWREEKEEVLTEIGVKRKAPRHREAAMREKYSDTLREPLFAAPEELPELIDIVQSKRKPDAIARDNTITAEKVGDKDNPEDVVEWAKNPGRVDLKGVDDEKDETEETEEPEEKDEE